MRRIEKLIVGADLKVGPYLGMLMFFAATAAHAQQRPLVTEDPETVGGGRILVEGGLDYGFDILYPASGLNGDLLRLALFGVSVGVSSIVEVQLDGGFWNRLTITDRRPAPLADLVDVTGNTTSDVEDFVIGTKIRLVPEGTSRPAFGLRFATKLPNASNESGLGLDTTDFHAVLLGAKTVRSVRTVGNIGIGILADPTRGDRQNDVITYGVSLARALTDQTEVVGELNGRANLRDLAPPGTESRSALRFGARYTRGLLRVDGVVILGLTSRDPGFGVGAGFTYVFTAFQVP
jgi:hypothetical protein